MNKFHKANKYLLFQLRKATLQHSNFMRRNKKKEEFRYISELSIGSLMEHLKLSKKDAESLLIKMADAGDVELLPSITPKAEALLNKLRISPSGKRRDYVN